MNTDKIGQVQKKLERAVWKWWFPLIFVGIQFIPTYTEKGFDPRNMGEVIGTILSNAILSSVETIYPLFKLVPILLVVLILLRIKGAARWLNVYAGISYILFAFLQHIAVTEEYGFSIVISNLIMILIVAASWFWDVFAQKNTFQFDELPVWKTWVVPLALLAFWYPINPETYLPDFNLAYLFTNSAGLAFCLMTPVYLAMLILNYPQVNIVTLRVTGLAGIIIASFNVLMNFIMYPDTLWWNGVLHIPLLMISGAALGQKRKM